MTRKSQKSLKTILHNPLDPLRHAISVKPQISQGPRRPTNGRRARELKCDRVRRRLRRKIRSHFNYPLLT